MKKDIILAGVGGQGVLSISALIGLAAMKAGLFLKQAEVHGMSQRGGEVHSHLRMSNTEIASDLIPEGKADLILSVEPMEGLRYLPMLSGDGWLVTNTQPYVNISNYPDLEMILREIEKVPRHLALNAEEMAKDLGSTRMMNTMMLGASVPFLMIPFEKFGEAIADFFASKGQELIDLNLAALRKGYDFAVKFTDPLI
ncbi:MAG TPA: indolepyruvate oxidoreductase subunit beta [Bacteroidales bacterium]|nr:indolepyruvate oxidoreductase subunit beta [Bacteroidales bacterium]HNS46909.1 indolepyruvate oxidoreductase subunit beta [Bacteroidales bacterium]